MQPTGTTTETKPNGAAPAEDPQAAVNARFDAMQARIDAQDRELAEHRGFRQAMTTRVEEPPEPLETPEVDPFENEAPDALLEAIGKEGYAALAKRGFIHRRDLAKIIEPMVDKIATQRVGEFAQTVESDRAFSREFPELADQDSPLYKQTAEVFKGMVASDPTLKGRPEGLAAAARAAREILKAQTANAGAGNGQTERRERIAAQSGDRGGRTSPAAGTDDTELTAEQVRMAEKFGIAPEAYAKRAAAGVRMSSRSGRAN